MADNVTATTGTNGNVTTIPDGTVFALDDVGGVKYQVVKLDVGGDGASTPVTAAAPLPVAGTILDGVSAAIKATVLDYTGSNPLAVRLTDTAGDYVGAGAGTQYTEDAAAAANPVGTAVNLIRADALAALTTTDGDNVAARGTDKGELYVKHVDALTVSSHAVTNAGTFAAQVDGAALTALQLIDDVVYSGDAALSKYAVIGAVFDDAATVAVTENQAQSLRMSTRRALLVEGVASGTAIPVSLAAAPSTAVTNAGTFVVQENGAALTALQLIDNAVSGAGFNITQIGGAAAPIGAGTEAAAVRVTLPTDGTGVVKLGAGTAEIGKLAAGSANIGDVDVASIAAGDNNIGNVDIVTLPGVAGTVAHDAADSGNPIKIGGIARQANPTAVAALDRVDGMYDDVGRQVVVVGHVRDLVGTQHVQIASSSSETTIITAGGSGVFNDISALVITNQTALVVNVTIKDDTAGTTRAIIALAPNGGAVIPYPVPLPQAVANKPWTATLSSASVTVNFHSVFLKNV